MQTAVLIGDCFDAHAATLRRIKTIIILSIVVARPLQGHIALAGLNNLRAVHRQCIVEIASMPQFAVQFCILAMKN
jgi:hypothetical protein